jgi:hypothetical protein
LKADSLAEIQACAIGALDACRSPGHWFYFQESLAAEILHAESLAGADPVWNQHVAILRHIADGGAQRLIHAHTLRQLYKNSPSSGSLTSQGIGFNYTMGWARKLAAQGRPPLVADLTNLVRIGDVLDCSIREYPKVFEVKRKQPHRQKLRKRNPVGRQVARMEAVVSMLETGISRMPDQRGQTITRVMQHKYQDNFDHVQDVLETAIRGETKVVTLSDREVILAAPSSVPFEKTMKQGLEAIGGHENRNIFLGTTGRLLNSPTPIVPSPSAWPLPIHCRLALLREQVQLVHIIDTGVFIEKAALHGVTLVHVPKGEPGFFKCSLDGNEVTIQIDALYETIFGFEQLDSGAERVVKCAQDLSGAVAANADQASNIPTYRAEQRQKGGPQEVPGGELVFPELYLGLRPHMLRPKRFLDGPWKIKIDRTSILQSVISSGSEAH